MRTYLSDRMFFAVHVNERVNSYIKIYSSILKYTQNTEVTMVQINHGKEHITSSVSGVVYPSTNN